MIGEGPKSALSTIMSVCHIFMTLAMKKKEDRTYWQDLVIFMLLVKTMPIEGIDEKLTHQCQLAIIQRHEVKD